VNARIEAAELQRWVDPGEDGWALLEAASRHITLSPRGVHRVIRVARTVADLEGSERVTEEHLAEALQYRLSPLVGGKLSAAEVG
jgi:magnesium chelatase family protein